MSKVKSHFSEYPNPTSLHFDPKQEMALYQESTGRTVGKHLREVTQTLAPIINTAYANGLQDGQEDAYKQIILLLSHANKKEEN